MSMISSKVIAILAANGFDENHMTEIQRALTSLKGKFKTVAPENGVVNGWQNDHWGHYFPVDANIGEALGSDYDVLVIPGGERAVAKLKTNPHTRRIINHFLEAGKPIAAIGAGVALLALSSHISGISVSAPVEFHAELQEAGAIVSDDVYVISGMVLTSNGSDSTTWVAEAMTLMQGEVALQAA